MPIVSVSIPPSVDATRVDVWVCRLCGRDAALVETTGAGVDEYFLKQLGWKHMVDGDVVCDRCKILPGVVHSLLADARAKTQ